LSVFGVRKKDTNEGELLKKKGNKGKNFLEFFSPRELERIF